MMASPHQRFGADARAPSYVLTALRALLGQPPSSAPRTSGAVLGGAPPRRLPSGVGTPQGWPRSIGHYPPGAHASMHKGLPHPKSPRLLLRFSSSSTYIMRYFSIFGGRGGSEIPGICRHKSGVARELRLSAGFYFSHIARGAIWSSGVIASTVAAGLSGRWPAESEDRSFLIARHSSPATCTRVTSPPPR
jgi:hypothetical protein